jgi:hypothetical protein
MDNSKQQVVDRIKQAMNVLVTVSANPSVDQLAAAIGLTLLLNKLGKHGTAVFSGEVPSTIEFLEPEKTLEKNTDSLRDFIIALDKSKADKLRYKVEENAVKIFITPYKTSLSEKDLDFSQGDFNVDVVLALGVRQQADLDQAITSHGRILHDATVVSISNLQGGELGSLHWQDTAASSLSEMVVSLSNDLDKTLLDSQIATALLTGIVAETKRFSNEKTTPATMSVSSLLMAAGANQQLVATKLQEAPSAPDDQKLPQPPYDSGPSTAPPAPEPPKTDGGTLEIAHEDKDAPSKTEPEQSSELVADEVVSDDKEIVPEVAESISENEAAANTNSSQDGPHFMTTPPTISGTLTANSHMEALDPTTDALSLPAVDAPFLSHDTDTGSPVFPSALDDKHLRLPPDEEKLTDIEQSVDSPHVNSLELASVPIAESDSHTSPVTETSSKDDSKVDEARNDVDAAFAANPEASSNPLPPIGALNAQPIFDLHDEATVSSSFDQPTSLPMPVIEPTNYVPNIDNTSPAVDQPIDAMNMPLPTASFSPNLVPETPTTSASQSNASSSSSAPPPVPPPMMPFPPTGL